MTAPIPRDILWADRNYRRLWLSLLFSAFAQQIAALALSLIAANTLQATPTQVALLAAAGSLPFALFMLPAGVWLDRMRKLPAYLLGEVLLCVMFATVPLAIAVDRLSIELLYAVAFAGACVSVFSGSAGQIVVTQVVRREQLIEAHGKSRIAGSLAEISGPGLAGISIKLAGVALTIVFNCLLMLCSAVLLRGLRIHEPPPAGAPVDFWPALKAGVRFVCADRSLLSMALAVACWQIAQTCAMVSQVLLATRELGLNEAEFGLCLAGAGVGTVLAGIFVHRLARWIGPGPTMIVGVALSGAGWLQLGYAPVGPVGIAAFVLMLFCFGSSVVLIFSNLLALRQAVTPPPMLARMTCTMRWFTLFPALPGYLLGGVLAESFGLRFPLILGGFGAIVLAVFLWQFSPLRAMKALALPGAAGAVPDSPRPGD